MMKVATLMVVLVIVAMFTAGITAYVADVNNNYDLNLTRTEFKVFDKINSTQALATDISENIKESGVTESDTLTTFVKGAFSGAKLLFSLPEMFTVLISDGFSAVQKYTGIPEAFQAGMIALVLIVLAMGFLYAVMKIKF